MTLKQNKWIVFPESVDSIRHIQEHCRTLGFPGCIGSIRCVHFFWNLFPAGLLTQCKGKERRRHQPMLALQFHIQKSSICFEYPFRLWRWQNNSKIQCRNYKLKKSGKHLEQQCLRVLQTRWNFWDWEGFYFICDGGYYQVADSLLPTTSISSMIPLKWFGAIINNWPEYDKIYGIQWVENQYS